MATRLRFEKIDVDGVSLAYVERGTSRSDAPTLFFVHATGFHGRTWDYHAEAFPDLHVIALDQRGHGRSENVSIDNWRTFGDDQAAVVKALGLTGLIGVGHSMGAHGMIDAAAHSGAFSRLLLLDPTVEAPGAYTPENQEDYGGTLHPAANRRNTFASPDEMMERLATKSSFPIFHDRIFRDYCVYGLDRAEASGFVLSCPPEIEARVYMSARSNDMIYDSVRSLDIPVTIVRAKQPDPHVPLDWSGSPTWPGLVGEFPNAREIHWSDCSHYIPMERPDEVIQLIREEVDQWTA